MGVRYSASESAMLIQAMGNNIQLANEVTDRLSSGCDHLIASLDSGELQGAAYTAGRGLFSDIIIPSIKKLQAAIDDIQTELDSYKVADGTVSGYGTLDLEELKRLEQLRNRQLDIVSQQIEENESFLSQVGALLSGKYGKLWSDTGYLYQAKENLEVDLQDIQEKIEKLEWFVSQVSSYFTDSLEILRLAIQGATQLSQVLVDSDGSYYTEGLDMNWVLGMKNQPLKSHTLAPGTSVTKAEKAKKLIIDDFKNSYDLDEESALALYNLQQGILERAERDGWSNEQVIYEYNRLVASFVPDNFVSIRWKAIVGTVNVDDRDRICRLYGLDTEEVDILSRKLIEQHKKEAISRDLAHEAVQLAAFTEQSWDFDISSIVHLISTIANTGRVHIGTTTARIPVPMEQYEISFKGDIDSGRYGDRDFNSDLDPINGYYLMKEADVKDIFTVQADYNRKIDANELNRVQEFYGVIGDGDVDKGKRLVEFIVRDDSSWGHQFITWGQSKEEKRQHQDAFKDYLERGGETNVE